MYKITDITSLGSEYNITTRDGKLVGLIQIIPFEDILDATLGPYTDAFLTYDNYIQKGVAMLSGFDKIDPKEVLWYTTQEEEVLLPGVVEYAMTNGYTTIILEYLAPTE